MEPAHTKKEQELRLNLLSEFYAHTAEIEYAEYEDPNFLDLFHRVKRIYADKIISTVGQIFGLISSILSLAAVISIVMTLSQVMILAALLPVLLNSQIIKQIKQEQHENDKAVSSLRRKMTSAAVLEKPYVLADVKLFGLKNFFINQFVEGQKEVDNLRGKLDGEHVKAEAGYRTAGLLGEGFMYSYLLYSVVKKGLSVGSMTICLSAVSQFSGNLKTLVNSYLNISANNLWIDDFIRHNELAEVRNYGDLAPVFDKSSDLEYRNVSCNYPGNGRRVIDKLNLVIRGDEKLSIVGHNGSSKTTFVKLLTRFYDPTEGEILLNGINVREYAPQNASEYSLRFFRTVRSSTSHSVKILFWLMSLTKISSRKSDMKAGLTRSRLSCQRDMTLSYTRHTTKHESTRQAGKSRKSPLHGHATTAEKCSFSTNKRRHWTRFRDIKFTSSLTI